MRDKRAVTEIILICFILLVCVTFIAVYNTWFNDYIKEQYILAEQQSIQTPEIEDVIGETLYFFNPYDNNLTIIKVSIEGKDCGIYSKANRGINEFNIIACADKITEPAVEVVVYTNKYVISKYVFMDKLKLPKGAIFGGNNCSELYKIAEDLTEDYYLTGDINCIDTKNWNGGSGFEPIGNTSLAFEGTLDGRGHTIYNLYINHSDKETGMFGSLDGAIIKNLNFDLLQLDGLKKSSGALAGFAENSTIINVRVKGNITGDKKTVGGIVGELQDSYMSGCSYEDGTVRGSDKSVGGIVGLLDNSEVHNSYSTGDVIGVKESSGGLIGYSKNSLVEDSYSTGYVYSSNGVQGGLIGSSLSSTVVDSYWDVNTSGETLSSGGLGLDTQTMKNSTTYSSWNHNFWMIIDGNYPRFK